jgi:hypothetical protein
MSSATVLCGVEDSTYGDVPRHTRIEARKRPQGFEVWFRDERLCPDGKVIATRDTDYNAQTFCNIMASSSAKDGSDCARRKSVSLHQPRVNASASIVALRPRSPVTTA